MKWAIPISVALLCSLNHLGGQTKINILSSDITDIIKQKDGSRKYFLRGNVGLQQDVAIMTCDSAILIQPDNTFEAFGKVKIVQSDTTVVTGEKLDYSGTDRTFIIRDNVQLTTPNSTLSTTVLTYNRTTSTARYKTRSTLYRKDLELTSNKGFYNTKSEVIRLQGDVEAVDPDYTLYTDTLIYFPSDNMYNFAGPSILTRDSSTTRCMLGSYDAEHSQLNLGAGASISSPGSYISADSISYNLKEERGELFSDALVSDSLEGFVLESHYIYYIKVPNYVNAFSPVFYRQSMDEGDTLYATGDTLSIRQDSSDARTVDLLHNTSFFSTAFQGRSRFFRYYELSEQLLLFPKPQLWSEQSQFSADSAILKLKDKKLDSLYLANNVSIISQTIDSSIYDQAVGKMLEGYFQDNKLHNLLLRGNAQNLMHSFGQGELLQGINNTACSLIEITFEDGEAKSVKASQSIDASYTPWEKASNEQKILPNCKPNFNLRATLGETRPKVTPPEFL